MAQSLNKMYTYILDTWSSNADIPKEQERNNMEDNLESWCERLLETNFEVWPLLKLYRSANDLL